MSSSLNPGTDASLVIAIDGPSGAGKSTIARLVAARLGVPYIDTGAMYRAVGLLAARAGLEPPFDGAEAERLGALASDHRIELVGDVEGQRILIDGEDVSEAIRTPECAMMASAVSAVSEVRRALVPVQQRIGRERGCVMEGRDIGSVVFPDATMKVYLTASPEVRAQRRFDELEQRGIDATKAEVKRQQQRRDLQDTSREDSPLQVSRGAVVIDTSGLSLDEVVSRLLSELDEMGDFRLDTTGENTIRSRNHGGLVRGESAPIEEESS